MVIGGVKSLPGVCRQAAPPSGRDGMVTLDLVTGFPVFFLLLVQELHNTSVYFLAPHLSPGALDQTSHFKFACIHKVPEQHRLYLNVWGFPCVSREIPSWAWWFPGVSTALLGTLSVSFRIAVSTCSSS